MLDTLQIPTEIKDGLKIGLGAIIVGFFVLVARLYRIYKTGQALESKYDHVTDETIRKELWTQWAIMKEELIQKEKENKTLALELVRLKGMYANALETSGVQTHEINQLKERIAQLEAGKK